MDNAVVGQHLDSLAPCGMYRLILLRCYREDFGERHLVGDRDVAILGDNAALLHGKQRELAFKGA